MYHLADSATHIIFNLYGNKCTAICDKQNGKTAGRALGAAPIIGDVSWRHGTVGRTLALNVRKVLESSQKKSGGCSQCCALWDYELWERYVSLPRN